jgi:chemotaxis protein CheD
MRTGPVTKAHVEVGCEVRVHITQGQFHVTRDANVVLTTTLGSCVAACIYDPEAGVGGMNHFLLPEEGAQGSPSAEAMRYGAYAMEVLMNGLLRAGARRDRFQAKLFGGARLTERLADIGGRNVEFAELFLRREGIRQLCGSVRGQKARKLEFWPSSGRVRQLVLERSIDAAKELERGRSFVRSESGAVDWFEE